MKIGRNEDKWDLVFSQKKRLVFVLLAVFVMFNIIVSITAMSKPVDIQEQRLGWVSGVFTRLVIPYKRKYSYPEPDVELRLESGKLLTIINFKNSVSKKSFVWYWPLIEDDKVDVLTILRETNPQSKRIIALAVSVNEREVFRNNYSIERFKKRKSGEVDWEPYSGHKTARIYWVVGNGFFVLAFFLIYRFRRN